MQFFSYIYYLFFRNFDSLNYWLLLFIFLICNFIYIRFFRLFNARNIKFMFFLKIWLLFLQILSFLFFLWLFFRLIIFLFVLYCFFLLFLFLKFLFFTLRFLRLLMIDRQLFFSNIFKINKKLITIYNNIRNILFKRNQISVFSYLFNGVGFKLLNVVLIWLYIFANHFSIFME
jgi:hypothetical protein